MNTLFKKIRFLLLLVLLTGLGAQANNITVSNIAIAERNDVDKYVLVQFDLTWDNSFRVGTGALENWDAAWIFMKYRRTGETATGYFHATLGATASHVIPTGFEANQPADNLGVFVYRDATGNGTATLTGLTLRWDYGVNGLDIVDNVDLQVFAIEMVYVPQGSFKVGSGGNETGSLTDGSWTSGNTIPYTVVSEAAIIISQTSGNLWGTSATGNSTFGGTGTLPAAFPKGYAAFYCMKHEVTQKAYVDFLNTLTRTQQNARTYTDISGTSIANRYVMTNTSGLSYRSGIRCDATLPASPNPVEFYCDLNGNGTPNEEADGLHVACNNTTASDLKAYLDWAALRPMTELEYEKAGRGPATPTINEYAWGAANPVSVTAIINAGLNNEAPATAGQQIVTADAYTAGPLRVGFAANTGNTRYQSGASYWGITELSGNVWERTVSMGTASGKAFTGLTGNGQLATNGDADVANWGEMGLKGGGQTSGIGWAMLSNREVASENQNSRGRHIGGRGVRQEQ